MKRELHLMKKEWIQMTHSNRLEEVLSPPPPLSFILSLSLSLSSHFLILKTTPFIDYTLEQSEEYESPFEDDEKVLKAKYDQGCKFSLPLRKNPV